MSIFHSQKFVTEGVFIRTIVITIISSLVLGVIGGGLLMFLLGNLKWLPNITIAPQGTSDNQRETNVISEDQAIINVAKNASPSVVSITISVDQPVYERGTEQISPFGNNFPFRIEMPTLRQRGTQKQIIGGGTGFIVSNDGYLLTNRHVVERADATYTVVTVDGEEHEARVLDRDPVNDLAVLKIDGNNLPTLELGDSREIQIGEHAIAIGYALGRFNNTVSVGVVSGLGRNIRAGDNMSGQSEALEDLIQTDAAINPGNSGGPLLDISGKVIGINVAVAEGSQNIGFAIPINAAKPVIDSVKTNGRIIRPQLGVRYTAITPDLAIRENLSVNYGALLVRGADSGSLAVIPGSPADKAGLEEGDIILEIDGERIDENHTLSSLIMRHQVGNAVNLKIIHNGYEKMVQVTLDEWKRAEE